MRDVIVDVLLGIGAVVFILSSLGIVLMRTMYDKLHYLAPMSTVGAGAIVAAVVVQKGASWASAKAVLVSIILAVSSAVLTQATARAMAERGRRLGKRGSEEK